MRNYKKWMATCVLVLLFIGMLSQAQAEETVGKYYGSKLSEEEQQYYAAMKEMYIGDDELPKTIGEEMEVELSGMISCSSSAALQEEVHKQTICLNNAYVAFIWDYPQVFWTQGVTASYGYYEYSNGTYKLASANVKVVNSINITQDELIIYNKGIQEAVNEVAESMTEGETAHDYYRKIHDWVCDKSVYNYDALTLPNEHLESYTSYPIFIEEGDALVVCEGYGEAYKILCDQLKLQKDIDLNCVIVIGVGVTADGQENHLWNAVQMPDNNWYGVDATWDDQEERIYTYFLCGQVSAGLEGMSFAKDHIENPQVTSITTVEYPEIAMYGYGVEHNYTWDYTDGILNISTSEALPNYLVTEGAPWYKYKDEIKAVRIQEGVTFIPEGLFANYQNIEELDIPFIGATQDSNESYDAVLGYIFGRGSSGVPQYFAREGDYVQYYTYQIPKTLTSVTISRDTEISFGAFSNCSNITYIEFGNCVSKIGEMVFYACSGLDKVKFEGNAPEIQSNAFYQCGELTAFIPDGNATWTSEKMVNYGASKIVWQTYNLILRGDMNGDNIINSDDAIYLLYHVMLAERYPISQNGDFDGNNILNSDDAISLLHYILLTN